MPATATRSPLCSCLATKGWLNHATRIPSPLSSRMVASVSLSFLNFVTLGAIATTVPTTVAWAPTMSEAIATGAPYVSQSKGRVRSRSRIVSMPSLARRLTSAGLTLGSAETRRIQGVGKDNYAQRVIDPTPAATEPERGSGLSKRLRLTIIAIVIIVIVVIGIIGYAVTGLAYAQTRVGNADKTLNAVVSHQNSLNTTVADLNSKFNGLSTSATFDPQQARTLFQQFAASETAAGVTDDQDDASLAASRATLSQQEWLTIVARSSLDKEAAKIDHARKALSIAKTAAAGYAQVGQFFQTYYGAQVDFQLVSTQVASADLAGAGATLATMKADVDKGLQLSSSPGLPSELHALMVDLGTLVTDFGKLLTAAAANDDTAITSAGNSVQADANKLGTYNIDKIMAEIARLLQADVRHDQLGDGQSRGLRPGLFDEDSITRRINRENILLLGGGRALLMQLAHPKVAAGVDEHSDFRAHPIRRLRRTIRMTMAIVFGDRETALAAARGVNQAHARVQGAGYRALDPDLLLWVYATLADTALVTYEMFVKRLLPREREDFYQEFKLLGELLGIPRDRFPDTVRDFDAYMEQMVSSGPVRVDARARELAAQVMRPRVWLLPRPGDDPVERGHDRPPAARAARAVRAGVGTAPAARIQAGRQRLSARDRAHAAAAARVAATGASIVFTAGGRSTTTS